MLLLLFPLLAVATVAVAQDAPSSTEEIAARGKELYENGSILYDEGRYEDAIVAWQEGYRLTQRPGFLYNVANAQERLGDWAGALDTLGRYRALAKTEERETLDRRIRNLEERLASTPEPQPTLEVVEPVPEEVPGSGANVARLVGGSMVGLGVVGAGIGSALGVSSRSAGAAAEEACVATGGGLLCPASASDDLDANRRLAVAADVGFGVSALLAAGGVVLWVVGGPEREEAVGLRIAPGGLTVAGRF